MGVKGFLAELRHRGVLKVAAAYLVTGVVVLEGVSILFHNFEAPAWVLKVFSTLVILGFPIACLLAWGLEFTPDGVRSARSSGSVSPPVPRRTDTLLAAVLAAIFALVVGIAVQQWQTSRRSDSAQGVVPVVIVMDTAAPHGVYDQDVRDSGGTNADALSETLRDLPVVLQKETVGATWAREDQILKQRPSLILIHRSSFFHSMNQEFGFGYPGEAGYDERRARALYDVAENKLQAFLGYVGRQNPDTLFLAYGRGTGGSWEDERDRTAWVERVEGRFPELKGRVTTLGIPGGVAGGSMRDEMTQQMFRQRVRKLLGLGQGDDPEAQAEGT
jgi:hypothetical protein